MKSGQAVSEKTFEDYEISNMFIAKEPGQITMRRTV